ncbi:MAG: hypothetical protein ACK48Y_03990, partial [Planctomyces sp.]
MPGTAALATPLTSLGTAAFLAATFHAAAFLAAAAFVHATAFLAALTASSSGRTAWSASSLG